MRVFKSEKEKKSVLESYDKLVVQWGVDTEKNIETKFGKTHVFLVGEKSNPPLSMFHGVGDNSAVMWVMNMHELSQYFYCIAIDTLGRPGKLYGKQDEAFSIAFPRKEKRLPNILSKEEVNKIVSVISNIKHRVIIMLIYSAGLRVTGFQKKQIIFFHLKEDITVVLTRVPCIVDIGSIFHVRRFL